MDKAGWVFVALTVVAAVLIVVGVTTHREPGFMQDAHTWERTPITVCGQTYPSVVPSDAHAREIEHAVAVLNAQLGFTMFNEGDTVCDVEVVFDVPLEVSADHPGGYTTIDTSFDHAYCSVRLTNVHGELLNLTLQHELGHCLGLAHDSFNSSIMRPVQVPTEGRFPPRVTDFDRRILRQRYVRE